MQSIHFNAYVGQDGLVQFQLPNDIKNQEVELFVIVQPVVQKIESTEKPADWAMQLQEAQQLVNQYLSEERDLVAELIDERRQAVNNE
jgi:hypothetical protein